MAIYAGPDRPFAFLPCCRDRQGDRCREDAGAFCILRRPIAARQALGLQVAHGANQGEPVTQSGCGTVHQDQRSAG